MIWEGNSVLEPAAVCHKSYWSYRGPLYYGPKCIFKALIAVCKDCKKYSNFMLQLTIYRFAYFYTAKETLYIKKMVKLHPKYDNIKYKKCIQNMIRCIPQNNYSLIGLWLPFIANLPYKEIGADAKQ